MERRRGSDDDGRGNEHEDSMLITEHTAAEELAEGSDVINGSLQEAGM